MKSCPNCGELLGTHADSCFKCRYHFSVGRVLSLDERENANKILEEERAKKERKRKEDDEKRREREQILKKEKLELIAKLPLYEYKTEIVYDTSTGAIDISRVDSVLEKYAIDGWRLHTVLTNEVGKNSSSGGIGGFSTGTNATIDQTILIFERMIHKGEL